MNFFFCDRLLIGVYGIESTANCKVSSEMLEMIKLEFKNELFSASSAGIRVHSFSSVSYFSCLGF